jgi:hypothetical protein
MQYQSQAIGAAAQANAMSGLLGMAQQGVNLASSLSNPNGTVPNYYPTSQANNLSNSSGSLFSPEPYSYTSPPAYGSYSTGTVMQPIQMSPSTGLFSGGMSGIGGSVGGAAGAGIMGS